jgi:hypothetical protein
MEDEDRGNLQRVEWASSGRAPTSQVLGGRELVKLVSFGFIKLDEFAILYL